MNSIPKILFSLVLIFIQSSGGWAQNLHDSPDSVVLGEIHRKSLESGFPWFTRNYKRYKPSHKILHKLQPQLSACSFVLVIGTWCSDSREHVPQFFKVADMLRIHPDSIRMFGVDRKKKRILTPELSALQIEYVPTILVYRNGNEVGRIVESTKVSMEKELLEMFKTNP